MDRQPRTTEKTVGLNCWSVSQLTAKVKGLLESEMGAVWVKGEISGFKPSPAGHLYFNLKDEFAVVNCARFRNASFQNALRSKIELQNGMEVLVHGRISVYPPRGNYQLLVDHVEPVGHGALHLAFEQLKARLQQEGLFDTDRKQKIPEYPSRIAIITSPTGAALQDLLNILERRNSGISVLVVPSLVQGEEAPAQLIQALRTVNQFRLAEVIVLARGGGSIEDLWCFNDEQVVRAIAESKIPVVSAVGHEVDFTLCDFVADLRAPTPSAAAELIAKNRWDLLQNLRSSERRMVSAFSNGVHQLKSCVLALENRLLSPAEKIVHKRKLLDELESRMRRVQEQQLATYRLKLETAAGRLDALSPLKVLARGYTLVEDAVSEKLLKSVQEIKKGHAVNILFHDGKIPARFS